MEKSEFPEPGISVYIANVKNGYTPDGKLSWDRLENVIECGFTEAGSRYFIASLGEMRVEVPTDEYIIVFEYSSSSNRGEALSPSKLNEKIAQTK